MWYLNSGLLLLLAAFCLAVGLLRRFCPAGAMHVILPIAELGILTYISWKLCVFMLLYIAVGYLFCRLLLRFRRSWLFFIMCILSLLPLFVARADTFGLTVPGWFVSVGVAYHILRMIDALYYVYYAELPVKPLILLEYMLFLPVFTSGPIFRYRDFSASYASPLPLTADRFTLSFKRVIRGLFKKVVLTALFLKAFEKLCAMDGHWYLSLCIIALSYLILYMDLSGYSDIAIAFGHMAGYNVPENFKQPWNAGSFTMFWRCWHATLSDFIREHIFVVIGRKKLSKWAGALIGLATMVIMGAWHGFYAPYLISGAYNGALLAIENLLGLTTVSQRKCGRVVYRLRCLAVSFLFAVNTLVFLLPWDGVVKVLQGLLRL